MPIPTIDEERRVSRKVDRAKRRAVARPREYMVARPGDEQFGKLPLDVQFERIIRLILEAKRKLEKFEKVKAKIVRLARKDGVRFDYTVVDGRVKDVRTLVDKELGGG